MKGLIFIGGNGPGCGKTVVGDELRALGHEVIEGVRTEAEIMSYRALGGIGIYVFRSAVKSTGNQVGPTDFEIAIRNDGPLEALQERARALPV